MKHFLKFFSAALLISAASLVAEECYTYPECKACTDCGSTFLLPRPQGSDTAALYNPYYYGCGSCPSDTCSAWTLGFRYNQTFDGENMAKCLLGSDKLAFIGSQATNQTPAEGYKFVRADDFGLSPFYSGTISFSPRIKNYNIDFTARWELGNWYDCLEGLYFGINSTLTHTSWDWRHCCATTEFATGFPINYMDIGQTFDGFTSVPDALQGKRGFGNASDNGAVQGPMRYGAFVLDDNAELTALANVDAILGYDFLRCDSYHFGAFIRASAPTGTRPYSLTIFEPMIGNGHHWELGGGIDAHWDLWNCDNQCIMSYLTGNVTHLFKDEQTRIIPGTINAGCCLSQYTLLKEFSYDDAGVLGFQGLVRGTEFAAREVHSSFDVQGDATLGFIYRNCGWAFGIGYNVFGRSHEKFEDIRAKCDLDGRYFGVKGLSLVTTGEEWDMTTASKYCLTDAALATDATFDADSTVLLTTGPTACGDCVTSTTTGCDEFRGVPRMITHKVFGHIDYQWEECEYKPFFGIGAEGEFGNNRNCEVCSPSQWGVWIRGGVSF